MLANDTALPRIARFVRAQAHLQPTVLIGSNHPVTELPCVREDNRGVGRAAAGHFLDRGYQHFGWLSMKRGRVESERRTAYVEALEEAGHRCHLLEWPVGDAVHGGDWGESGRWLAGEIERLPKPLALLAVDDLLAIDAVQVCVDSGVRVPEEVAVLGVANMEVACECAQVALSSIDENLCEIAYRSARLLDHLMDGGVPPEESEIVPIRGLVVRRSTDVFAISDPALERASTFMTENLQRAFSMEALARHVGVSLRALHYIFKRELHRSPGQHLLRLRLERARTLLERDSLKVGEVARESGFLTARNFHRSFLRAFGVPPAAYRARHRALKGAPGSR